MKILFWFKSILAVLALFASSQAFALCAAQDMAGDWHNTDPNTGGITRVQIVFACNDTVHNGHPANAPDTVHLWGACHPTDCDWGTTNLVNKFWDGRAHQTSYTEAVYSMGHAITRLKFYRLAVNRLMVISLTDFRDSSRPDYSSIAYFAK